MGQRDDFVKIAESYMGARRGNARHKEILMYYNKIRPLPRGYNVQTADPWCAAFVSAMAYKAGMTDYPFECSCGRMVKAFQSKGQWIEDDKHIPEKGEIVFYDWSDDKNFSSTDNKGAPNHVGICVMSKAGVITVIEGNMGARSEVGYRYVDVNGRYIRGFGVPVFKDSKPKETTSSKSATANEQAIFDYLLIKGLTPEGAAGVMGNLMAESSLRSNNLQNSGNKRLGMTDEEYTAAVDNGTYTNFVRDSIGYGYAQWTYWSLKQGLLDMSKAQKKSIAEPTLQIDYLVDTVKPKRALFEILTKDHDIEMAAKRFMLDYERPANQSESAQNARAKMAKDLYDRCMKKYNKR